MNATGIVNEYLSAFYKGDFERARTRVAEDFKFQGPFVVTEGRQQFFESAARLAPLVRGYELRHQWTDGTDVCTIFDVHLQSTAGTGSVTFCEWHTVRDGMLARGRAILDRMAFQALLPPAR